MQKWLIVIPVQVRARLFPPSQDPVSTHWAQGPIASEEKEQATFTQGRNPLDQRAHQSTPWSHRLPHFSAHHGIPRLHQGVCTSHWCFTRRSWGSPVPETEGRASGSHRIRISYTNSSRKELSHSLRKAGVFCAEMGGLFVSLLNV